MTAIARILGPVAAAMSLASCDAVISKQPIFEDKDAVGAPTLKPGLWADPDCTPEGLKAHAPVCAQTFEVTAQTVKPVFDDRALSGAKAQSAAMAKLTEQNKSKAPSPYLLAAGNPLIVQVRLDEESYGFYALEPVAVADGAILTEAYIWPVLCGPPAGDDKKASSKASGSEDFSFPSPTEKPFPGITVTAGDPFCHPEDREAVIGAARKSREIASLMPVNVPGGEHVRWLSDLAKTTDEAPDDAADTQQAAPDETK